MNRSPPNWSSHIKTLEHTGLTQGQIAKRIGVSQPTVARLKNNPDYRPAWDTGEALLMCVGEITT